MGIDDFEPVIYTRTRYLDYRLMVAPRSLEFSPLLDEVCLAARNVMAEDHGRGAIRGQRWHILRVEEKILIGIASYESTRTDGFRPIRGYYGILMPCEMSLLPTHDTFHALYQFYVEPHFNEKNEKTIFCQLSKELAEKIVSEEIVPRKMHFDFNLNPSLVRFFDEGTPRVAILLAALEEARKNSTFEFVWGLSEKIHALERPIMNAVCSGVLPCVEKRIEQDQIVEDRKHPTAKIDEDSREGKSKSEKLEFAIEYDSGMKGMIQDLIRYFVEFLKRFVSGVKVDLKREQAYPKFDHAEPSTTPMARTGEVEEIDFSYGLKDRRRKGKST